MFFEDQISSAYLEALERIAASEDWTFSVLAELGQLDLRSDFKDKDLSGLDLRGSDLRGFDFSGSNLTDCIRDQTTIIDGSTVLTGCLLRWVELETTPIVEKMSKILTASNSLERRKLLVDLIDEHKSPVHINQFLMSAMGKADAIDAFFDFCNVMVGPLSDEKHRSIRRKLASLLKKGVKRKSRNRSGMGSTGVQLGNVTRRLEETSNDALILALDHIETHSGKVTMPDLIAYLEGHGDLLSEI